MDVGCTSWGLRKKGICYVGIMLCMGYMPLLHAEPVSGGFIVCGRHWYDHPQYCFRIREPFYSSNRQCHSTG